MGKAYRKDIWRSILKSKKRFISILIITALGVTVLTGIYAACKDLYLSADRFYDEQNLFDIRILSTLGLTADDVDALKQVDEIENADGEYSEKVHTVVEYLEKTAEMTLLSQSGMNLPYVMEGALPARSGEIAVQQKYLDETGKSIGDTLTISEIFEDESPVSTQKSQDAVPAVSPTADKNSFDTEVNWDADVEIEQTESPTFPLSQYVISAVVQNPLDISNSSKDFRSTATADYIFFILPQDANTDVFTSVSITLKELREMNCFTDGYDDAVQIAINKIETQIKQQQEQARYEAVMEKAITSITDAEETMNDKFTEADAQFNDVWVEIEEAKQELLDGEAKLTAEEKDALQKLADAYDELHIAKQTLKDAQTKLTASEKELVANEAEWKTSAARLDNTKAQLADKQLDAEEQMRAAAQTFITEQAKLDTARAQLAPGIEELKALFGTAWPESDWNALVSAAASETARLIAANPSGTPDPAVVAAATADTQATLGAAIAMLENPILSATLPACIQAGLSSGIIEGGQQSLNAQKSIFEAEKLAVSEQFMYARDELSAGESTLEQGRILLADGRAEMEAGKAQMATAFLQLADGEIRLSEEKTDALRKISDAWIEIAEGRQELADGELELIENEEKYLAKKAQAKQKVSDAYTELQDIDTTQWYVQARGSLSSYSSLKNDMSSIEAVGNAFPVVFLIIAILISLTTMTRMVEEERGLIGTYKALGFSNKAIYKKYIIYAFAACFLGGILGDLCGFILFPKFLIGILQLLYTLPNIYLSFDFLYGIGGIALFMVGIVGSTALACRAELAQMPAALMRPKTPRVGSRVFLEYIPFLWNRFKFLNKVTARNLFRYKKRMFMTVIGIMGCTALVLAGFAIRDSVTELMPKQYDIIYQYDLMVITDTKDNAAWIQQVEKENYIADSLNLQIDNIKLIGKDGKNETVQLMVVPSGASLEEYILMQDRDGKPIPLNNSSLFVTQNAAELLALQPGDTLTLQNSQLEQQEVAVSNIVQNYLGNNAYITQELYETMFEASAPNATLAHLAKECPDQIAYAESLLDNDLVLSAVSIAALKADFATNFTMLNSVVYVIIILAAGLAFVVLFTLSNTNISERLRELATIKVLGFFDREVHTYVNKEMLILTTIGVLLGLPVGRMISELLTAALKMPSLYFAVHVKTSSYVLSALISFSFAFVVNLMTNRILDKINMVEALKSVE